MPQVDAFEIIPRAPYAFDLTAARFGRFVSEIVDLLDGISSLYPLQSSQMGLLHAFLP